MCSNNFQFKKMQQETYRNLAVDFDSSLKRDNRNHFNKIKIISKYLKISNGENILEIGVGTGIHAKYLFKLNSDVKFDFVGIDYSKDMIKEASKKIKGFDCNAKLFVMDGENLDFQDDTFDKVYISGSIHHFFNPEKGISEIIRVLKKGGKFCVVEPNYFFPTNFYFAHRKKEEKNIKLMRVGNFKHWLNKLHVHYKIFNFAYTPPFPKFLIPLYDRLDEFISKIPYLNKLSIMIFVFGVKQ